MAACGHDSVSAELWADDPLAKAVVGWERAPARSWRADDPVLVGVDVHGGSVAVDFTEPTHWIVQGQTRSGKSSLMYALLGQLSVSSAVVVAMSDPTGILASAYAGTRHAAWQVGGLDDVAAHAALLDRLMELMVSRTSMLLAGRSDKLVEFTPDLPLMVLVLEELPGLISAAVTDDRLNARRAVDRVADRISAARGRLIAEGAKVGIRVVMLCQRADASILGGFDRSNVATRLTLRVDSSEAVRMLHQEAPPDLLQAQLTAPPGVGLIEGPGLALRRIRTPHVSYADYLDAVERASAEGVSSDD
ncbi:MAG: hypothetical protein H0U22_15565 [Geodermatophilaceae bacterium]|nr:hypothetical protein [Geodermatophilaceae bacterium]